MKSKNKQILVVGDRVLIRPDLGEKKSKAGLYLPPSVIEKQEILSGVIVEVGPGIPLGNPEESVSMPGAGYQQAATPQLDKPHHRKVVTWERCRPKVNTLLGPTAVA